jgi:light-regulated signal transduction histidine kinase (bacteriophytochrome)
MNEVVQLVFYHLKDKKKNIILNITPMPQVFCDRALLLEVMTNLLSNAIKFTSIREEAVIEVGSGRLANETYFYVRDNGAGFDMNYSAKLFGVFQRLHRQDEFEGTGVGLAIVKRIIQRHGGKVWAEGIPEIGATFYFTLPEKEGK